ncbi:MAG: DNA translocase FtsK [Alphaproteobacteria bacterium]
MINDKFFYIILKIVNKSTGLLLMIFSVIYLLALLSFNSADPSFNSASSQAVISNLMGNFGSHLADLSFQLIGISSFFLILIIFNIGKKMFTKNSLKNFIPKLIVLPFCILSFSVFFASIPLPSWWEFTSLGGVNGQFIISKFNNLSPLLIGSFGFFISLFLISFVIEISLKDWIFYLRYSYVSFKYFYRKLFKTDKNKLEITTINVSDNNLENVDENLQNEYYQNQANADSQDQEEESEEFEESEIDEQNDSQNELDDNATLKEKLKQASKPKKPKKRANFKLPPIDLLVDRSGENKDKKIGRDVVENQSKMLIKVLEDFGVKGLAVGAKVGPVITLHEFEPEAGTKASRVIALSDDIARSMSSVSARIAVVSGKTSIGIELPNPKREMIFLREMLEAKDYKFSQFYLPIILGKDIGGEIMIADLAKMPHLLIAGTTGSGKSVGLNVMILSLLYKLRPDECKFIMIDPKMLELSIYDGIPHLLSPVVTEPSKAVVALKWVVAEMEERYRLMSSFAVRNIVGYNEKVEKAIINKEKLMRKVQTGFDPTNGKPIIEEIEFEPKKLPFIIVIVDEMADLMLVAGKEIENSVQRLAQMARAAGIHLIMATQRPSVDVITGVIKANFPTRISFQVTSRIDSRTILGVQGAEQLLGQGDMIYMSGGSKMVRVHGPFCSDREIENIVNFIKAQNYEDDSEEQKISFDEPLPELDQRDSVLGDDDGSGEGDLYKKAVMIVRRDKKASISYVQRQLRIGYNRAANLIEKMEQEGVVTTPNISGKREIIEE